MNYNNLTKLLPILLFLSCGGNGDGERRDVAEKAEAVLVDAVILDYNIRVENIPLIGPQTELLTLTISEHGVKYEGKAEIQVADELKEVKRASFLDFRDGSLAVLDYKDSSYLLSFLDTVKTDENDSLREMEMSGEDYAIQLVPTEEVQTIMDFNDCHQINLKPVDFVDKQGISSDSVPVLKGHMWLKSGFASDELIGNYYSILAKYYDNPGFEGLEIWRVFKKLGVPRRAISGILRDLEALIIEGDFVCRMYSLGKKANVSIKLTLTDIMEDKVPATLFQIPAEFKPAFGKEALKQ